MKWLDEIGRLCAYVSAPAVAYVAFASNLAPVLDGVRPARPLAMFDPGQRIATALLTIVILWGTFYAIRCVWRSR